MKMANIEDKEGEELSNTDALPEEATLNFQFTFHVEGSLPHFSITLDGRPLLSLTYHREMLLPDYPLAESPTVERLINRFEGLLPEKIRNAVTQLFIEAFAGHEKQPASFFEMLSKLDDTKGRVGIKRGKEAKLTSAEQSNLDTRYDELHETYKEWKRLHKEAKRLNGRGKSHDEWRAIWRVGIEKAANPDSHIDLLERLADPDSYDSSPSEIAYTHLARECGYEVEYVKKVVRKVRRSKKSPR